MLYFFPHQSLPCSPVMRPCRPIQPISFCTCCHSCLFTKWLRCLACGGYRTLRVALLIWHSFQQTYEQSGLYCAARKSASQPHQKNARTAHSCTWSYPSLQSLLSLLRASPMHRLFAGWNQAMRQLECWWLILFGE
jgi:hypothetical protein